ncbi:YaaR family protein [Bacillus sp. T33-2]|uniref:YaaR family protein n=1 Tax=Bacillus sp. T33-2 TaxID=2054168 RepID=UPI000C7669AC|nr:YaaR family protein [Bacillus sp. T33-2]PLR93323.1 DUF327 domain-containing protein [Bacillus sp. T33-2]
MKINQDFSLNLDKIRQNRQPAAGQLKFGELVQKQEHKMHMGQIQQLLSEIDNAGERLSRSRTFKDLARYKSLVKRFVKETVDFGMGLKQSHSWNQFGEGRSLKIVEIIDGHLVELTEGIMKQEEKSIDILGRIGEIKGLLINLYT